MTEFNDDNQVTPQKPKNEFIEECSKDVAELKPLPSIGKAFLIYAVIPLALFILPELIDRILKMDFMSSATALFGSSNITSKSSSSSHIISSSDQRRPIVNIDKELVCRAPNRENSILWKYNIFLVRTRNDTHFLFFFLLAISTKYEGKYAEAKRATDARSRGET